MHTSRLSRGPSTCPWPIVRLALAALWLTSAQAVTPKPAEFAARQQWVERVFGLQTTGADRPHLQVIEDNPFGMSFTYDGRPSSELLKEWKRVATETPMGSKGSQREIVYRDPATGLEVRLVATVFQAFPAVEWVAYLRNAGESRTPLLESIQALDTVMPVPAEGRPTLHWAKGGVASFDDFAPQTTVLQPGKPLHLQPGGGRSSSQVMP